MPLRDLKAVFKGITPATKKLKGVVSPALLLSLVGTEKSFHLECATTEERDDWVGVTCGPCSFRDCDRLAPGTVDCFLRDAAQLGVAKASVSAQALARGTKAAAARASLKW